MARSDNNLHAVLLDTANAIRNKTGSSGLIVPRDFADEIATISTGTPTFEVSVSITNGSYTGSNLIGVNGVSVIVVEADSGYNLPSTISVSGATSYYDKDKGGIVLSNPTGNVSITIECEADTQWTFGVSGISNSTPTLTRTDDSANFTWTKSSSTGIIVSDFDQYFNFEEITDGGNTFIRVPKMYYKRTADTIQLSNHTQSTFNVHPLFLDENGNEMDYFDVGKYKGSVSNNKLYSYSGTTPTGNITITDFRTYARANNTSSYQYLLTDIRYLSWLWMMWMVVFADRQTETVMGTSWYSYSGATTGHTDSLVNNALTYPRSICAQDPTTHSFKFYGIEDVVGAGYELIDGITFSGTTIKYCLKPSQYVSSTFTGYTTLGYNRTSNSSTANITMMGLDASNSAIMYPTSATGTSYTTYYCDSVNYSSSGTTLFFGASVFYASDGVFYCSGSGGFSNASGSIRSRLCRQAL